MRTLAVSTLGLAVLVAAVPASAKNAAPEATDNTLGMALLSAAVDQNGTLYQNSGAVSATKVDTGLYSVTFNRSVVGCSIAGTLGSPIPLGAPDAVGQMNVTPLDSAADTIRVRTSNATGIGTNKNFHVILFCAR